MNSKLTSLHIDPSDVEMLELIRKLEFHQIELEMQNEELRLAKEQAVFDAEKYATLYDFAPTGYFTLSKEGDIIELNLSGSQMLGLGRSILKGSRFGFFVSEDTRPIFNMFINKVFRFKTKATCEVTLSTNDIQLIYVHLTGIASENGEQCLVNMVDITESKRSAQLLHDAHRRMESIIKGTCVGTWEWNVQTGETIFNEVWAQIIGYTLKELTPVSIKTWVTLTHPDDLEKSNELLNRHFTGEIPYYDCECRMKHKDGIWVWIHDRGQVMSCTENGQPLKMFGIHTDITARKQAEAEIKLKNEELQKVNAEKDKFFSIVAHDLRSPFNGFLGLTDILATGLSDLNMDEIQKIGVAMKNSANNLYILLENLLEWSRMQRGLINFAPETFFLKPKLLADLSFILDAANKKKINICYEFRQEISIYADENMFGGIIRNLVSNAVKFTPKGGSITISAKSVSDKFIEISVMDIGIGMDKDMIDNLFRLGVSTNRQGTEGETSTGLGLLICKDYIEKHGGEFWAESEIGKGSTFRFTIPGVILNPTL